jgi:oligopeptide transport system substrate-binding protein
LFFLVLCIAFSCRQKQAAGGKTVFRYNESAGITSLDPAFARNQANIWGVNQLFNGLVQLDDKLQVRPCIARTWEIQDEGRRYVFHLRQDVWFHESVCFKESGIRNQESEIAPTQNRASPTKLSRRVTASDFVYSFNRVVDPSLASPGAWVFNEVKHEGNHYAFAAPDDSTLVIELAHSFPPFTGILSMQYCSVVPKEAIDFYGKDFRRNPVGTGPFCFKMWKEGVKLVLLKNEHYFEREGEKQLPYLDAVSVSFIVDKQSVFLEFVKGNIDFMSGIDASYKDELLTKSGRLNSKYSDRFDMISSPYLNTEYLGILVDQDLPLVKRNPLALKKIRQAINYSFDRRKMMRYLRNNIGYPGVYGFVPPALPGFDRQNTAYFEYDPAKAKRLLAEAGFPDAKGLPEISLSTNNSYLDLATYIQQALNETGFNIKLDVYPPASMREMIANSKLNFFRASWIADYPDAENYLSLFYSPNFCPQGPNYTHFKNGGFDALYQKAQNMNDSSRFTLYRQMDQKIMDEAPVVVLYYDQVLRFVNKKVEGLGVNPLNLLTLKKVRILKH